MSEILNYGTIKSQRTNKHQLSKCHKRGRWKLIMAYETREMVKVSYYYYKKNMTQGEIGEKMGMSRQRVNRLLKKALEERIVKISIEHVDMDNVHLENKLEEIYGLEQAVVVSCIDENRIFKALGLAGAEYLEKALRENYKIGVTGGKTLSEVSKCIKKNTSLGVSAVQLIGGINIAYTDMDSSEITKNIAKKLGGEAYILYAPFIVKNREIKDALMSDDNLKNRFEKMKDCNLLMVGIGELDGDTRLYDEKGFNEDYKRHLMEKGAIGDIGFRWFNIKGEKVDHEYEDRTIGYDALENRYSNKIIAVSGGKRKHRAILGALRGKYVDVLITDSETARYLIENEIGADKDE